ncbi:uncharacterized protein LOC114361204 [Ostrinia furnacalis]|uniref:uncharacterized protein LOC114361204 n=1 Tax=Ostrinia furnacalis TaxID=93504 RepID=UPI00103D1C56|nr:uncharacterized protein LOC114361204 [Ostrinia furnacalis]XP_028171984.1 uncharacterized protein LOC114361204 [Ostrinia furnacalis]XP_028171985.1 uncharacterized protein LOC114361204 [Ostrinia furnacalis]XP_028171986.1 uncharacterized protein LOC114361204 [Ostrinia furnacalis]
MVSERPPVNGGVGPPTRPRTIRRNCGDQVFITSPSTVYIDTSVKSSYYSQNDEDAQRLTPKSNLEDRVRLIEVLEHKCWLSFRTVLRDGEIEIQDLIAFIGNSKTLFT